MADKPTDQYGGHSVVAQQVLVKFRSVTPAVIQLFQQLADADEVRQLGGTSGVHLFHSKSKNVVTLLAALQRAEVLFVEPDYVLHASAVPNDPSFPQLWGLHNSSVTGADISAEPAWDISTGSTANVVGVVDTGISYSHADLSANVWSAPRSFTVPLSFGNVTCAAGSHGFNVITRTCDPLDDNGHGTHVSGTIGAVGNNAVGVAGVNWQTRIIGLKFLGSNGSGATSDAIDAIEFAIQVKAFFANSATPVNVRVLSNSWGGSSFSQSLLNEINRANTNEMLFVAAAGNAGANNDVTPNYPSNYQAANVVAVAATDSSDARAGFSNYGRNTVHLGAPGVSILSTYLGGGYATLSGTSMATPHVAGAAMLVLSACSLNTAALKAALVNNVDLIPSMATTTISGGRLNVNRAIRSCAPLSSGATSIWSPSAVPGTAWNPNSSSVTLGVKFRSDVTGTVTGVRFYKGSGNNGPHTGLLYSNTGTLLAQANFTGETASGWQEVTFSTPVAIAANTTYIAAYFTSTGYAYDFGYFTQAGVDNAPLHALRSGVDGPNSVYSAGGSPQFPAFSYGDSNYWVDVVFSAGAAPPPPPPPPPPPSAVSIWSPSAVPGTPWNPNSNPVTLGVKFRSDVTGTVAGIRFYKGSGNNGPHTGLLYSNTGTLLAQANFTGETASGWQQVTFSTPVAIAANTTYIAAYFTSTGYAYDFGYFTQTGVDNAPLHALRSGVDGPNSVYSAGGSPQFPASTYGDSNYWVDVVFSAGGAPPPPPPPPPSGVSIWSSSAVPGTPWNPNSNPVTLGVKFRSDVAGTVTGVRFYKGSGNNGPHTGLLYSNTGTLLAQANFTGETASGWQQVSFSAPVAIAANTTYIAAYFTSTGYAYDFGYFTQTGVDNAPLHALRSGVDGPNSVYSAGAAPQFPASSYGDSNYWVDVLFSAGP